MVQMTASDQMIVKALPGNNKCADCGMKNPQWASISFGTVFCLECSGVHRSLGVHISFVRSIAMDSWTPQQLALMKAGGNAKCAAYLQSKGVNSSTPIKAKYESPAAQLYKEVLKARVDGRPEPTELPKPKSRAPYTPSPSSGGMPSMAAGKPGEDPNGMERLTGETEQQYVARQTKLKEQARARMAAKFGNSGGSMGGVGSGGMGSSGRMAGIGSNSGYNPNSGGYGTGAPDVGSLVSSFGSALGTLGSSVSAIVTDEKNVAAASSLAASVGSTGASYFNSFSSMASSAVNQMAQPSAGGDGLADLQRQMQSQRSTTGSKYSGFGSNSMSNGGSSNYSNNNNSAPSSSSNGNGGLTEAVGLPGEDKDGVAALTGESDAQYVIRQKRIREEAKARMAAKFGGGGGLSSAASSASSSSSYGGSRSNSGLPFGSQAQTPSAPSSGNKDFALPPANTSRSAPSSGNAPQMNGGMTSKRMNATKVKVDATGDDFFSSFGS